MNEPSPLEVTQLLEAINGGDAKAASDLLPMVYEELRRLARARMANEPDGHTLQATALVHEAYLRVIGHADERKWDNRGHFFGAAALAMRRILVERARHHARIKRGGDRRRVTLDENAAVFDEDATDLLALNEALTKLEGYDKRKSEVVMLRYFAGLSIEETASALDLSPATVKNEWTFARAWLHRELNKGEKGAAG
jgi:RNA polymerase sigma factor (TIGR02999 family)